MKVVVLHDAVGPDARPDERDGLVQVEAVSRSLRRLGHATAAVGVTLDLAAGAGAIATERPKVVFNLVESPAGRGRFIHLATALLDSIGVRYTGARTEAMFLTSNKPLAKRILRAHGIRTPPWLVPGSSPAEGPPLPGRFMVKSVWEDASLGLDDGAVVAASDADELRAAIRARRPRLGGQAFAEAYVDGREFDLALLAGDERVEVLPPAEICFDAFPPGKPRIVSYSAKWHEQSFEYHHTPRRFDFPPRDDRMLAELKRIAAQCWELFGLCGYARVDFRVDADGVPWVLEVNANPCLSPDAGFVAAAQRAGLSYEQVVARILDAALVPCDQPVTASP